MHNNCFLLFFAIDNEISDCTCHIVVPIRMRIQTVPTGSMSYANGQASRLWSSYFYTLNPHPLRTGPHTYSAHKWAAAWQNLKLTCAPSEDSDQPGQGLFMRTAKAPIIRCGCPAWSESLLGAQAILLVLSCCGLKANRWKICFSWTAFSCLK